MDTSLEKKSDNLKNKLENLPSTIPLFQKFGTKESIKLTNSTNVRYKGF